ncbi:MAG: hypothetical protein ACJ8FY_09380 [Gemmataceae bacterium]
MSCPAVGSFPEDYSASLPKGVPPFLKPPTSFQIIPGKRTDDEEFVFPAIGPADTTWYFPIALDKTNPTGVFIPQGFSFGKEVDIILYFHGNKQALWNYISDYWLGGVRGIRLREDVNDAQKNVLLVAPTMGASPGASWNTPDVGIFKDPGMATCFLDHVMAWLGNYEPRFNKRAPDVRRIVLAGHSGGGVPIQYLKDPLRGKLCEIWCFDTVVLDPNEWARFARFNPTIDISFFQAVQFDLAAMKSAKKKVETDFGITLDNLHLIDTKNHTLAGHYPTVTNYFRNQVKNATCFAAR